MSRSVLYMSMSLDGFIAGPDDGPGQGLGAGGECLHDWLGDRGGDGPSSFRPSGPSGEVFDEVLATGCRARRAPHVRHRRPLGRRSPRRPDLRPDPGRAARAGRRTGSTTSPTGSRARCARPRQAAGDANVLVHGADLAQSCLRAGVLDELEIQLIPVLLGDGTTPVRRARRRARRARADPRHRRPRRHPPALPGGVMTAAAPTAASVRSSRPGRAAIRAAAMACDPLDADAARGYCQSEGDSRGQ